MVVTKKTITQNFLTFWANRRRLKKSLWSWRPNRSKETFLKKILLPHRLQKKNLGIAHHKFSRILNLQICKNISRIFFVLFFCEVEISESLFSYFLSYTMTLIAPSFFWKILISIGVGWNFFYAKIVKYVLALPEAMCDVLLKCLIHIPIADDICKLLENTRKSRNNQTSYITIFGKNTQKWILWKDNS